MRLNFDVRSIYPPAPLLQATVFLTYLAEERHTLILSIAPLKPTCADVAGFLIFLAEEQRAFEL